MNLGELVTRLTGDIDVMREAMLKKEQKLAALFKKTSKIMSEYEKETEEMVKLLHKARDEQVFVCLKKLSSLSIYISKVEAKKLCSKL